LPAVIACACDEPPAPAPKPAAPSAASVAPRPTAQPTATSEPDDIEVDPSSAVEDEPPSDEAEAEAACAPADPAIKPMQLLRFTFTSGIEGKDAKDKLAVARPGQRVFAHLHMRNRSKRERCIHVTFSVGGKERSHVTLKIGDSWEWRTWAYATVKSDEKAPLRVVVTDDQGATIVDKLLGVVPR
jgi:hypothetical protein